jgi:glycosyltransferase involved in cell wall biosynthesis
LKQVNIFSTRSIFPVEKGDQVIIFNRLRVLSADYNINVYLIGNHDASNQQILSRRQGLSINFIRVPVSYGAIIFRFFTQTLLRRLPLQCALFSSKRLRKIISQLNEEEINLVYTIRASTEFNRPNKNTILEAIDSMELNTKQIVDGNTKVFSSLILRFENWVLKKCEKSIVNRFHHSTFVSKKDLRMSGSAKSIWMPNGMSPVIHAVNQPSHNGILDCVFSGNLSYLPNRVAAEFLIEVFSASSVNHRITFLGVNGEWIKDYESDKVKYAGEVDDMVESLSRFDIFLCPVFVSSGMQNKVLEASAAGLPVFMSERVSEPFEFPKDLVRAVPRQHDAWRSLICELSDNREAITSYAYSLQTFLGKKFSWDNVNKLINELTLNNRNSD